MLFGRLRIELGHSLGFVSSLRKLGQVKCFFSSRIFAFYACYVPSRLVKHPFCVKEKEVLHLLKGPSLGGLEREEKSPAPSENQTHDLKSLAL